VKKGVWVHIISSFFANPLLYLFLLMVFMQYRRQTLFERKLFSVRIHSPWVQWFDSILYGVVGGVIASLLLIGLGVVIQPDVFWLVWGLSLILSFFHIQYLCFAYAGGLTCVFSLLAGLWPKGIEVSGLSWLWSTLIHLEIPSLLAIIAILHLVEAFLVYANAGKDASPLFISGKRGLLVGAFQLQKFWFVPIFALVMVPGKGMSFSFADWWPLFFHGADTGLSFLLLPTVIGYAELAVSTLPSKKAKKSGKKLLLYSLVLLGLAWASGIWHWVGMAAALFAIFGHEGMIWVEKWVEWNHKPVFVQLGQGVVVLSVLPKSPADLLGIQIGDVILKVNGHDIFHRDDIYPALQVNSAHCKMEVQNMDGHIKYLQRALYQGDHHQLGLIVAPDENSMYYVEMKRINIFKLLRQEISRGA
jgi:hypothetical protein